MKYLKLLTLLAFSGFLPLLICSSIANASATTNLIAAKIDSKSDNEKPWINETGLSPSDPVFSPNGQFVAVPNQKDDTVSVFKVEALTGVLTQIPTSPFQTGSTPNSVAFSPNGQLAAVANFQDNTITVFKIDASGLFTPVQGSPFPTGKAPASVEFSRNGRLAAVANKADDTITVFKVDASGLFTSIAGSPFPTGKYPIAITFSPNGQLAAVANRHSNNLTVFKIDASGLFTPIAGSPFKTGKAPTSVAFSPSGHFAAVANFQDNSITVFKIDASGLFTPIAGSPFKNDKAPTSVRFSPNGQLVAIASKRDDQIAMFKVDPSLFTPIQKLLFKAHSPSSVAFSPNGQLAAITDSDSNTLWIYEFEGQTGAMSPITGRLLKAQKKENEELNKKTKEAFAQFGKQPHPTEQTQRAGFGEYMPNPIELALKEYIVEPNAAQIAHSKETAQEAALKRAIADTKQKRKDNAEMKMELFTVIQNHDDRKGVSQYLNALTINARDENNNTPLILAATYDRKNASSALLEYKGKIQETEYNSETVSADLTLVNFDGNTALMVAASKGYFAIALRLAQAMIERAPQALCLKNKNKQSAYDFALPYQAMHSKSSTYQELLALLTKHCSQDNAKRKALADKEEEDARPTKKIKSDTKDVKKTNEKMNKDE